ncbi:MAG: ribonuclease E/G [Saprospiraceae bacterium]
MSKIVERNSKPVPTEPKNAKLDKELIINSTPTEVEIALLENGRLVELHHQKTNTNFTVGDIFVGRIRKLMPGLNAAFVDIGHKKDAFLHYTDLGPKLRSLIKYTNDSVTGKQNTPLLDRFSFEPEIVKTGKITQVLSKKERILVQILKEPISTKGPRLSCEVTIPGRYVVLTPFSDIIAVSKKISSSDERKRLRTLIESIKPKNFGLIVRTAAEGKRVAELHEELVGLMKKWEEIHKQLHKAEPPKKLLSELDKASSILRDVLSDSFNKIVVNDKELYDNTKTLLGAISPEQVKIVKHHRSNKAIFDAYGITRQIKASFGKTATMHSGAYLVIESTEAMHVIDVNSGHKVTTGDQAQAVLNVNMESAEEIARQLRLRDIGGLIIIDFIDMRNSDHKRLLLKTMRDSMRRDRAQHTILPLSKFGLMQITRQRVRPEVKINTAEVCPSCEGSGKINPSILLTDNIERDLEYILQSRPNSKIHLHVHPYIYAYLKQGFPNIQMRWFRKYFKWIKLVSKGDYQVMEYTFYDDNEDEIRL